MSDAHEPSPLDPAKLVFATLSDPGRVRPENQDAAALLNNVSNERLAVVADGMGGHRGGETASKLCIDTLGRIFRDPHGTPEERLRRGLELANEEVYSAALSNPELKGMGTTAVALLFGAGTRGVWLAWVGDSRCYRLRGGTLKQLTVDHTLAGAGIKGRNAGVLVRALGVEKSVEVDVMVEAPLPGDVYLLCSDGLTRMVSAEEIEKILRQTPDLQEATNKLVECANAEGGKDNITAVLARIAPAS